MALEQSKSTKIATNLTRTRVTVLVLNLTVIFLMLSVIGAHDRTASHMLLRRI
jgi:hypothetical protein